MRNFCLIMFFLFLNFQLIIAQTGYKEIDTVKYTKNELIANNDGFKTTVYYKDAIIRKIIREFKGSSFSSLTIYYLLNDKLVHNIFVSLRKPNDYYEEHMYLNEKGIMYKWENTRDKEVNPFKPVFEEKEKLVMKFFEDDLKEAKTKKALH